ncbi:hypothetical protein RJT34_15501 [Clitoria ternatea]|uniref:Uncharacterized protein n=1 Tax=Clitoria ternatea TaxID=43366 RepID=A0AAN9J5J2_CLITE
MFVDFHTYQVDFVECSGFSSFSFITYQLVLINKNFQLRSSVSNNKEWKKSLKVISMGRTPCCDKKGLKKGPWTAEEDEILVNYIKKNGGHGSWRSLPKLAGLVFMFFSPFLCLLRCGKSCRLRWTNYLRPDIKRGPFTLEEEKLVIQLHAILGNRWAAIASQLGGRTDNEIKNLWNTHLRKRLICMGIDPQTHEPLVSESISTRHMAQWESARLEAEARLSTESSLHNISTCKTDSDYFLRMWNSEIGDSFRGGMQHKPSSCHTSNKCGSSTNVKQDFEWCQGKINASDSSSSSSELVDDSCDTSLQLLLDFPINNDMSFLE